MPRLEVRGFSVVKRFAKYRRILGEVVKGDVFALQEVADVYVDAIRRELLVPGTGRTYYGESGPHVASAPGESPVNWSGNLFWAIDSLIIDGKRVGVGVDSTKAPYWEDQEYGTVNMAPRPFIRPVLRLKNRRAVGQFKRRLRERAQKIVASAR